MNKKIRRASLIVFVLALVIVGVWMVKHIFNFSHEIKLSFQSENVSGRLEEVNNALQNELSRPEEARVDNFQVRVPKNKKEMVLRGQLYTGEESVYLDYEEYANSGTLRVDKEETIEHEKYLTWGQLYGAIKAMDIDRIINYNADYITIEYPLKPSNTYEGEFSKEERQQIYNYNNIEDIPVEGEGMHRLGYYLYDGKQCYPVEDMSKMTGRYYCIDVIFFGRDQENKGYDGKASLGILVKK